MSNHQILNFADHPQLRVRTDASVALGDGVMACLAVPAEFRQLQGEFPIVFRRDVERGTFCAMALFGFENGENLFLENGRWTTRHRPLALAIQPFLVGRPATDGGEAQVHVDMAHPRISTDGEGTRVFDDDGTPTPYLAAIADRLGALHVGYQDSEGFFAALVRHDLLEPFTLDVKLDNGSQNSLVGFHVINEERLRSLDADALGMLHAADYLTPVFMALASLSQFAELIARKNARVTGD